MIEMTLAEVAEAVGGVAHGEATVTGGAFLDTRTPEAGGLFVAIAGERVDGHAFATTAVAAGAAGVLASREVDAPAVIVDAVPGAAVSEAAHDEGGAAVIVALQTLARAVVDRLDQLDVVGITGSSGKTSTKDLLAQLLARLGPTVAPPGSFNNELGHPYTVLRADRTTRFLVLETSARGIGHIRYLAEIAPPDVDGTIVRALNAAGARSSFVEIQSDKGHDAFLLDEPVMRAAVSGFLEAAAVARGLT